MAAPPPLSRTVPPVSTVAGPYASQGMISPTNPLVDAQGSPTAVSFRFLHGLFQSINQLQMEVQTLQQRLANAGIP